jgi:hypothetical protein
MHCRTCTILRMPGNTLSKARAVKTENNGDRTHRIYRCSNPKCAQTFHTIEVSRDRFRELERIEVAVRNFADEFHRETQDSPS